MLLYTVKNKLDISRQVAAPTLRGNGYATRHAASTVNRDDSPRSFPKFHPVSVVVNSVFRLASPGTGRSNVLNRGGRLDGGASGDDARGCVVDGVEPRGKLEVVHGLLGLDEASGDLVDLAGDELRILAVDGHLGDRADLVFQALDLGLDELEVLLGLVQVLQAAAAGFQVVQKCLADGLPG